MSRFLEFLRDVIKGIVVGLANVVPGVSGGTMMVSMGIYDRLISAVSHFFSKMKEHFLFLLAILIGMAIAILGGSVLISWLFDRFPFPTTMAFIGLILGGLPLIFKKVRRETRRVGYFISFALFFAMVVGLSFLSGASGYTADLTPSVSSMLLLFLVGIVAAGTMVVPGVSGSMVLLIMGYYNPIMKTIRDFLAAIKAHDTETLVTSLKILIPLGIGVLVGIVLFAKLIEWLFKRFPVYVYWAIIGLIVASPIGIIRLSSFGTITVASALVGAGLLIAGAFAAYNLSE